jgi:hypothetical protein
MSMKGESGGLTIHYKIFNDGVTDLVTAGLPSGMRMHQVPGWWRAGRG